MIDLIHELCNSIGLYPQFWMDGIMCMANDWLMWVIVYGGLLVFGLYLMFAATVFQHRERLSTLIGDKYFPILLSLVFVFCGICHYSHATGKLVPLFYLFSLSYIILIPCMIALLNNLLANKDKIYHMVSPEEAQVINLRTERINMAIHLLMSKADDDTFLKANRILGDLYNQK